MILKEVPRSEPTREVAMANALTKEPKAARRARGTKDTNKKTKKVRRKVRRKPSESDPRDGSCKSMSNQTAVTEPMSSSSDQSGTPQRKKGKKTIPKNSSIREVDGQLWRVDKDGILLQKVRKRKKTKKGGVTTNKGATTIEYYPIPQEGDGGGTSDGFLYTVKSVPSPSLPKKSNLRSLDKLSSLGANDKKPSLVLSSSISEDETIQSVSEKHKMKLVPKNTHEESDMIVWKVDRQGKKITKIRRRVGEASGGETTKRDPRRTRRRQRRKEAVTSLERKLRASEFEVARLSRVNEEQQTRVEETMTEVKKLQHELHTTTQDKQDLSNEVDKLRLSLEAKQERECDDDIDESHKTSSTKSHLLLDSIEAKQARAKSMLNQMEEEVKFLETELLKIKQRSEQGHRLFAGKTMYDKDSFNNKRNNSRSLGLVESISSRYNECSADQTNTDASETDSMRLRQLIVGELWDRVRMSHDLNTLVEIREEDEEDVRMAKEALKAHAMLKPCIVNGSSNNKPQSVTWNDQIETFPRDGTVKSFLSLDSSDSSLESNIPATEQRLYSIIE